MIFKMNDIKKNIKETSGYALVEQIVSIVIIGIIATSMISFLSSTSRTFDQIKTRKQLVIDNTVGIEMLTQEFSHMYRIITTDSKLIRFTTSMDTNVVIAYKLEESGLLSRSTGGGSFHTIAQNVDFTLER